jgi:hypothetical protein
MSTCAHCGKSLEGKRSHARTCSSRCRKALSWESVRKARSRHCELPPLVVDLAYRNSAWCCLCEREHAPCRFTRGSLFCILDGCRNPHHRRRAAMTTIRH